MSDFAKYLEAYMGEKEITTAELAREMDMDRAVVYRYIKGTRVPSEEKTVAKLAQALRMTVKEKQILMEEYDRLIIGDYAVNNFKYICRFFHEQRKIETVQPSKKSLWNMSEVWKLEHDILSLDNKEEIATCIGNLFRYAAQPEKEGVEIKLLMQSVYEEVQNYIFPIFNGTGAKVEQIICLEQNISKSYKNLEIFQKILPVCFASFDCKIRYYYDYSSHHINDMTWMPNVIIVENYVIQFNYDMTKGIMVKKPSYASVMRTQYEQMRKQTLPFLDERGGALDIAEVYGNLTGDGIYMFTEPCVGNCISSDILQDYIVDFPQKKEMIENMSKILGDWKGKVFYPPTGASLSKHISYCTESGIRNFMETGRVAEFPDDFYKLLGAEARLTVLERVIYMMERGQVIYRILDDKIELPEKICIYVENERRSVTLNKVEADRVVKVKVEESGIYHAFSDFAEYLEKKDLILNEEKTLLFLREIHREYSQKLGGY